MKKLISNARTPEIVIIEARPGKRPQIVATIEDGSVDSIVVVIKYRGMVPQRVKLPLWVDRRQIENLLRECWQIIVSEEWQEDLPRIFRAIAEGSSLAEITTALKNHF